MSPAPDSDPRFSDFVLLQAQNAGLFLGCLPDPRTGKPGVNLRAARSVLDSLEMLEAKTRGNLSADEEKLLEITLKNLRPLYQNAAAATQASDDQP